MEHIKYRNHSKKIRFSRKFWMFCGIMLFISTASYYFLNDKKIVVYFGFNKKIPAPVVNIPSSYSTSAIGVVLTSPSKKYKIYYTLDGTKPNSSKAFLYNDIPLVIDENVFKDSFLFSIPTSPRWQQPIGKPFCINVLRAVCVDENGNSGEECIQSYIIDPQKTHKYNVPVVSLVFEQNDFFGYKKGIYVMGKTYEDKRNYIKKKIRFDIPWWNYPANYLDKGASSDRSVSLQFIDLTTHCALQLNTKMRIHGFNTRGFAQKSLRFSYTGNDTEKSCIPMLNGIQTTSNYIFRNGGNDWTKTLVRDALVHELMIESSLSAQAYQPVVCFFNGEYWGIHTLRERFDAAFIENKYGISKDSLALLELDGIVLEGGKSDATAYKNLVNFILTKDLSSPENYSVVEKEIDLVNLIDYYLVNLYFVNNDWPHNNCKYWRFKSSVSEGGYRDKKWRYVLYDLDWSMGFNISAAYKSNSFDYLKSNTNMGKMLFSLIKNSKFKVLFTERANILLENNFSKSNTIAHLNKMTQELDPLIQEHINRWRVIGSKSNWEENILELELFLKERPVYFKKQLEQFLKSN